MSQAKKWNTRRKALAVGLAVLGVAGLSLASAAQLTLNGQDSDLVQAGVDSIDANLCQSSTINVSFTLEGATPGTLATGGEFGYPAAADAIELDAIDGECAGKQIKVALGDADGDLVGTEYSGTAAEGVLTLALNGTDSDFGAAMNNAAIDSIAQVSVTIFG